MDKKALIGELHFTTARSSGPGGQHANKVASKVILHFDLEGSKILHDTEGLRLREKLAHRLTDDGRLLLQCDTHRSQHKNKAEVIDRFLVLIAQALEKRKKRRKSKPSKSAIAKRLKGKKIRALKKAQRKKPRLE